MEKVTQELMNSLVGQEIDVFSLQDEQQVGKLAISKVEQGRIDTEEFSSFSISLLGDPKNQLPQDNYLFKHNAFGEYPMFMSIHDIDKYQIVISRKRN
ncbi:hypothetical protein N473_02435 [Pseudoalteromonas luteoviolacea CPMOR-1]|uniref:DUF6916 domain-containing protein n=2 Tax=Pseudoalteromonas luteoviolacea TaxID=43657 RepID=A0A167IPA7_9GAMM|nr:hypothetical protein [Pseudoalteromonas luteoviolacea]KID56243.1 hypothetical protein JF50_18450 [Pseudoalteromonas luteoviolacea]KZN59789.1 hypothetical protein N473_02435 [Pseudoalteromonas luteoviolacea CPMOR-1]